MKVLAHPLWLKYLKGFTQRGAESTCNARCHDVPPAPKLATPRDATGDLRQGKQRIPPATSF